MIAHANLDVEARWAGGSLAPAVAARVSAYGALLAALAPDDPAPDADESTIEVWAPAAVDATRLAAIAGHRVSVRVGTPPRADVVWADAGPIGKAANDRRFGLALAGELGVALPGARVITSGEKLEQALPVGPWICKLPWTAAGRDRCRGAGAPTPEQRTRLGRLLARCGALVVEPWCERIVDAGQCGSVDETGAIAIRPAHALLVDARGGFLGIELATPALEATELAQLEATARAAGAALARLAFVGRYAIDAFAYRAPDGARRFHPLCELNARTTFGWIAHALAARLGTRQLGFSPAPPGATVLVRDTGDGVTAWAR